MASKEGQPQPNTVEKNGGRIRNVGIVIAALGLIAEVAALAIGGSVLAVSGEIYRRSNTKSK